MVDMDMIDMDMVDEDNDNKDKDNGNKDNDNKDNSNKDNDNTDSDNEDMSKKTTATKTTTCLPLIPVSHVLGSSCGPWSCSLLPFAEIQFPQVHTLFQYWSPGWHRSVLPAERSISATFDIKLSERKEKI